MGPGCVGVEQRVSAVDRNTPDGLIIMLRYLHLRSGFLVRRRVMRQNVGDILSRGPMCRERILPSRTRTGLNVAEQSWYGRSVMRKCYSLCRITIKPMIPSMTLFSHGCSLSIIVTYPTAGI